MHQSLFFFFFFVAFSFSFRTLCYSSSRGVLFLSFSHTHTHICWVFSFYRVTSFVFTQRIPLEMISVDDEDDFDSIRPVRPHHTSTPMHQLQYQSSPRAFRPSSRTSGRTFHSTSYQVYPSNELPSPSAASGHTDPYGTIV